MRLICPSCQSEYNVDAAAIGAKGRMVRCANCGGEWFQAPEEAAAATAAPRRAPAPAPDHDAYDDNDASERYEDEAQDGYAHEAEADVARHPSAAIEGQGYRVIDDRPVVYDDAPEVERSFPAEEEEYGTTRYGEGRDTAALTASLHDDEDIRPASGRGLASFFGGFATSAVLVGLCVVVYVAAPSIVSAIPALDGPMAGYVSVVDKGRTVLNVLAGG